MNYSHSLSRRNKSIANICLKKSIANIYIIQNRTHMVKKHHGSHNDVESLEKIFSKMAFWLNAMAEK